MKTKILLFIVAMFFCNYSNSQEITSQLKLFYENADMNCYLSKIENNINSYFLKTYKDWGFENSGLPIRKIEIQNEEVVPILSIQFVCTDSIKFGDDIYGYIAIDSCVVLNLAFVDSKMNILAMGHFWDGLHGYTTIDKRFAPNYFTRRNLIHAIRNINKENPELILCNPNMYNSASFFFVKESYIYVYQQHGKNIIELNDFIWSNYNINSVRGFNSTLIPYIYREDGESWRYTGNTPENEKNICPN